MSDLSARLKSGVPAALVVLAIMAWGPAWLIGTVVTVFALIGIWEFNNLFKNKHLFLQEAILLSGTLVIGIATLWGGLFGLTVGLLIVVLSLMFHHLLFRPLQTLAEFPVLGVSLFGVLWVSWGLHHLALVKDLPEGTPLLFLLVFIIWISDTAAYFGGKRFGKHPLAPQISPKKTIEGSVCGLVGAGLVSLIFALFVLDSLGVWEGLLIGMLVAAVGQMGDLVESKLKRLCEVKDSGGIFPGHGGALDRVDGFLTAAPVFFYLMV